MISSISVPREGNISGNQSPSKIYQKKMENYDDLGFRIVALIGYAG
ncbi:MAG: hypothetical protein ACTSWN_02900 [Promethearchaeota archaeon]